VRTINEIIVHCSATNCPEYGPKEIRDDHMIVRGWSDIGYHFVIDPTGVIHEGRNLERAGAHVRGRNSHSVGICLMGLDNFTEEQFTSLAVLVRILMKSFGLKEEQVNPHNKYANKLCPNFDLDEWKETHLSDGGKKWKQFMN